ncbi:hypothetical protein [Streptomyces sp. SM12]|uniref:hypothetical protein n=1 Tax=Streptomyces sp. SM12 TaxID=1071602 RepID=UPI000CD50BA9|nr:hypothetical protein [Streptomyces sp. SM12]
MAQIPRLGPVGPAQSDSLVHFTGRPGARSSAVPAEICAMAPEERLDSILASQRLWGFPPFGSDTSCLCFSESPPDHLAHLIVERGFAPWGVVITRSQMMSVGGGSVAYVPEEVYRKFQWSGLGSWAVRTEDDSLWMHEREWRLPLLRSTPPGAKLKNLRAILIGDPQWRPSPIGSGQWVHPEDGEPCPGGCPEPQCHELTVMPQLWQNTEIWVWDAVEAEVRAHSPGTLR